MSSTPGPSNVTKHKSGKPLRSGEKIIVLNVFNKLCEKYPTIAFKEIEKLTSEYTGVSVHSVVNVRNEINKTGKLVTPSKKRKREQTVIGKFDEFDRNAVRLKVHKLYFKNETPTLKKILSAVNDDPDMPNIKRTSLHKLLLSLGFEFVSRNRQSVIIDREDIILWRRNYLKKIRDYRNENRSIFYLDETWVNEGHTTSNVWRDTTVKSAKQAFLEGLSTGPKLVNKGKRLILLHIGNERGFLKDGLLLFESKKSGDYHVEMNGDVFKNWFEKIVGLFPEKSVIIMDNAPYHSVKLSRVPNSSWRKCDIVSWLCEKNINFDENYVKAELLELVKNCKHLFNKYLIDNLAEKKGHTVLRLPPYHCMLNPIELIWSQVKGYVAQNNKTFKLSDVRKLVEEGLATVTADKWRNCVNHVIEEENNMWKLDKCVDVVIDRLVINLNDDESSESASECDMDGINSLSDESA